jgi:alkaline phosphatase D
MKTPSISILLFFIGILTVSNSCQRSKVTIDYTFDGIPDRIWVGEEFWTVPIEDWNVKNGRIECKSPALNSTFSLLKYVLAENDGDFTISVDMGLLEKGKNHGSSGFSLGVQALEEKDLRAAIYFGSGINLGVNTEGYAFLDQQIKNLPENFSFENFKIELAGENKSDGYTITMNILDNAGASVAVFSMQTDSRISGLIQIVNNIRGSSLPQGGPRFWFDNLSIAGKKIEEKKENIFGPILWAMYTQSNRILKLTAQLPPLGENDNKNAELLIEENGKWNSYASDLMNEDARTVSFRIDNWDATKEQKYRVSFSFVNSLGNTETAEYDGIIQREPIDRPLRLGALTCQHANGFPYSPLVKNLGLSKPDMLYFSGDQIYESNGGYGIKRTPEDLAIINYLGKWYMFGWAFGDLMRNVPTFCTPDDHDVFQGNIWGEGGSNFTQSIKFINTVNHTHSSHHPDAYDPTPTEAGMTVWYTGFNYGNISFAIITDRGFKSDPQRVATWEGRPDHILNPLKDPGSIEKPDLVLLGERQEYFLNNWVHDWNGSVMKVLLSQTVFGNIATHHGTYDSYIYGDMDSNGWPKEARDRVLRILRKGYVFQIAGDQHLPSITHYGIDDFRDAGYCYVTPAISVGYSRWFRPDDINYPVTNRPDHGHPNTGNFIDAFGNKNYVYAIGNAINFKPNVNRYELAHDKTSGYGIIILDQNSRDITMESWRFLVDVENPSQDAQHPGWPHKINQFDNYTREAKAWLPNLKITGKNDPVVEVYNQVSGETEYIVRIKGDSFSPKVFSEDVFTINVGYPETNEWKTLENLKPSKTEGSDELNIEF